MDRQVTREVIEDVLQQHGIDTHFEKFSREAYYLSSLVSYHKIPLAQALETVQDQQLRAELTPFMYAIELSHLVNTMKISHQITSEQADDYLHFLHQMSNNE
jgi:hypothetical protein